MKKHIDILFFHLYPVVRSSLRAWHLFKACTFLGTWHARPSFKKKKSIFWQGPLTLKTTLKDFIEQSLKGGGGNIKNYFTYNH